MKYLLAIIFLTSFVSGTLQAQTVAVTKASSKIESIFSKKKKSGVVTSTLRDGLRSFGRRIDGYDAPDAVLTAAETRTSAPLRILRDRELLYALGHSRIYPCGEGAGYAGGITSASVDGLRAALALMARFSPIAEEAVGTF